MRTYNIKAILKAALRALSIIPFAAVVAFGQQTVNLTAEPTSITLPDGSTVPMWGYSCTALAAGVTSTATCAKLNPLAATATLTTPAGWSPVVITVPTGQSLTINLTNHLSFTPTGSTAANTVPTSLTIVGQLGGGLGTTATSTPSPDHSNAQQTTWPIANPLATGTPPVQGPRVQSFSTEVAAGATTALTWTTPRPGTYLIESGTHPSIQGPMGLIGMLVVTTAPTVAGAGTAYPAVGTTPAVTYSAEVPLLMSEIDPVQNNAVQTAVNTAGFSEIKVWSGQPGGCGNPSSTTYHTCYPPAVNYTPLYYLFNGVAFNKTNASASLFPSLPATGLTPGAGTVFVRLVNAGLHMHLPSNVGSQSGTAVAPAVPPSGFSLIAEDGNPLPGVPRVQSEVFMAAGKTYDVMVNVPAAPAAGTTATALPVFDRELSLSGNATARDAGMLAYIGINAAGIPAAPAFAAAVANPDTYSSLVPCAALPCAAFTVSDPGKGLIANDVNVYGVQVFVAPTHGTLTLNANGTFTYVPTGTGTNPDSFTYCANGKIVAPTPPATTATCSSGLTASVTMGAATLEGASGIRMGNITYTASVATSLSIKSPGVLSVDSDAAGYPLTVAMTSVSALSGGGTLAMDANGGFNASVTGPGTYTFNYRAQNSQGTLSASSATVTLIFPTPSNLAVTVLDGKTKAAVTDYRWIIEEDRTFYVNPNCTTNTAILAAGCAPLAGTTVPPTFGLNFHTSYMPVVATGCVGPTGAALACEVGQTVFDPATGTHKPAACDIGNGVCRTTATQETPVGPSQVHLDPTKRYYISVLPGDAANPF